MTLREINNKIAELENEKELIFISEITKVFDLYPTYSVRLDCSMESNDEGGSEVYMSYIEDVYNIEVDDEVVVVDENSSFQVKDFLGKLEDIITEMDDEYLYNKLSDGSDIYFNKKSIEDFK